MYGGTVCEKLCIVGRGIRFEITLLGIYQHYMGRFAYDVAQETVLKTVKLWYIILFVVYIPWVYPLDPALSHVINYWDWRSILQNELPRAQGQGD